MENRCQAPGRGPRDSGLAGERQTFVASACWESSTASCARSRGRTCETICRHGRVSSELCISSSACAYAGRISPPTPITRSDFVTITFGLTGVAPTSTNAPGSTIVPPTRASDSASANVSATPVQSATTSAPRPSVKSASAAGSRRSAPIAAAKVEPGLMQVGDEDTLGAEENRLQDVADAKRPAAQYDHRLAAAHRLVEPVRDRHRLGQHRHLVGNLVRHAEQRRAGEQVHPLGPSAPEARRPRQGQRVAVVLEPLAHEVRLAAPAPPAGPAGDIRRRHDPRRRASSTSPNWSTKRAPLPSSASTPTFSCPQTSG